jgi:hypothetical protein
MNLQLAEIFKVKQHILKRNKLIKKIMRYKYRTSIKTHN